MPYPSEASCRPPASTIWRNCGDQGVRLKSPTSRVCLLQLTSPGEGVQLTVSRSRHTGAERRKRVRRDEAKWSRLADKRWERNVERWIRVVRIDHFEMVPGVPGKKCDASVVIATNEFLVGITIKQTLKWRFPSRCHLHQEYKIGVLIEDFVQCGLETFIRSQHIDDKYAKRCLVGIRELRRCCR
jgi:hypothetical protein